MKLILILVFLMFSAPLWAGGTSLGSGTGTSNSTPTLQRLTSTVAALPACSVTLRGAMYVVTNALLPAALATVAGGGAVVVGVMCDGTNWIVN